MNKSSTINTKSSFFAKYALINLLGQVLVVISGIVCMPILISSMGTELFGVLILAWAVTGYFSIFDLGIGRAMTKLISEKLGRRDLDDIPSLVWTGIFFMLLVGLLGTCLLYFFSPLLVKEALSIPINLQSDTIKAFFLLAFCIPIVVTSSSLRGILEAYQRFDLMNYIRIPMGILTFLSPLIVLQFAKNIVFIVASLVVVRLIEWFVNLLCCLNIIPELRKKITIKKILLKQLVSFGGWITISNIAGPLISYMDRFLIGSLVSLTAVTYYTVPFDLNIRVMVIPGAIVGVLFSAFSATYQNNRESSAKMFFTGLKYTFICVYPIILLITFFASDGLELWLGKEFAIESTIVLQLLAFGSIISCLSYIPTALIQAAGRPDVTGKLHFFELPIYLLSLYLLVQVYGIEGAAIAFVLRVLVDVIVLLIFSLKLLPNNISAKRLFVFIIGSIPLTLLPLFINMSILVKCSFTVLILGAFIVLVWKVIMDSEERNFIILNVKNKVFNKKIDSKSLK